MQYVKTENTGNIVNRENTQFAAQLVNNVMQEIWSKRKTQAAIERAAIQNMALEPEKYIGANLTIGENGEMIANKEFLQTLKQDFSGGDVLPTAKITPITDSSKNIDKILGQQKEDINRAVGYNKPIAEMQNKLSGRGILSPANLTTKDITTESMSPTDSIPDNTNSNSLFNLLPGSKLFKDKSDLFTDKTTPIGPIGNTESKPPVQIIKSKDTTKSKSEKNSKSKSQGEDITISSTGTTQEANIKAKELFQYDIQDAAVNLMNDKGYSALKRAKRWADVFDKGSIGDEINDLAKERKEYIEAKYGRRTGMMPQETLDAMIKVGIPGLTAKQGVDTRISTSTSNSTNFGDKQPKPFMFTSKVNGVDVQIADYPNKTSSPANGVTVTHDLLPKYMGNNVGSAKAILKKHGYTVSDKEGTKGNITDKDGNNVGTFISNQQFQNRDIPYNVISGIILHSDETDVSGSFQTK